MVGSPDQDFGMRVGVGWGDSRPSPPGWRATGHLKKVPWREKSKLPAGQTSSEQLPDTREWLYLGGDS